MPPDESIVFSYLKGVAEEFSIDWGNTENDDENGMEEENPASRHWKGFKKWGKKDKKHKNYYNTVNYYYDNGYGGNGRQFEIIFL